MCVESLIPALRKLATKFRKEIRDELLSEAVIAIYAAKERYNPELGEFTPYALRTAFCAMAEFVQTDRVVRVNHSAQWRHQQRTDDDHTYKHAVIKGALSAYVPLVEMQSGDCGPSVGLELQESVEKLAASMRQLNEQESKIIMSKYVHGMSMARISQEMGIPIKRASRIAAWALTVLRRDLLWCQEE